IAGRPYRPRFPRPRADLKVRPSGRDARRYDANVPDFFRSDAAELAEDARSLLTELDRDAPGVANLNGECRPPLDVFETNEAVQVLVDIPGVDVDSLRVAVRRSTVLLVGAKLPVALHAGARFHLAERAYG